MHIPTGKIVETTEDLGNEYTMLTDKELEYLETFQEKDRPEELQKIREGDADAKQAVLDHYLANTKGIFPDQGKKVPKHEPDNHKKRKIESKSKRKMVKNSKKKNRKRK